MNPQTFERRMRALECFHSLRVLPGAWPVVRVDGRSFSRLTERRFGKPFDERFSALMTGAAEALLTELGGLFAYTESDEISVLLPRETTLFDREVEKLVSISAAVAAGVFSIGLGAPVQFDARIWVGASRELVLDYFRWRQADAGRCALNGWAYWTLRREGRSVDEATKALLGASVADKNELLFQRGVNFDDLPAWQKRGTGIYWEAFERAGWNPEAGITTTTRRRRLRIDRELPLGAAYDRLLLQLVESAG
jgi:tRNA(His) 5'-end guanylyltransferase